jgi:hypothetical protein
LLSSSLPANVVASSALIRSPALSILIATLYRKDGSGF